jgi:hypothetical protein
MAAISTKHFSGQTLSEAEQPLKIQRYLTTTSLGADFNPPNIYRVEAQHDN